MMALHRRSLEPAGAFALSMVVRNNSQSRAAEYAREQGIPFVHLSSATHTDEDERDDAMVAALTLSGTELVVTAGYMKKVGVNGHLNFPAGGQEISPVVAMVFPMDGHEISPPVVRWPVA